MKPDLTLGKDMEKRSDAYTINTADIATAVEHGKSRGGSNTKKVAIIAVAVVVIVVVVAGAMTGAMHMMTKSHEYAIKAYKVQGNDGNGDEITEDIEIDTEQQTTTTDATYDDKHFKLIQDHKRGLQVARAKGNDGQVSCFVSILNKTSALSPAALETYMETHPNQNVDPIRADNVNEEMFTVAEEPIDDITFLGAKAEQMCQGHDTFWVYPDNHDNHTQSGDGDKREKRAGIPTVARNCPARSKLLRCKQYKPTVCIWDCCNNYFFYKIFSGGKWNYYIYTYNCHSAQMSIPPNSCTCR